MIRDLFDSEEVEVADEAASLSVRAAQASEALELVPNFCSDLAPDGVEPEEAARHRRDLATDAFAARVHQIEGRK